MSYGFGFRYLLLGMFFIGLSEVSSQTVTIDGGSYLPLYGAKESLQVKVKPFRLDQSLVTNSDFLSFLRKHPEWRRSQVKQLFAEKSYLAEWREDLLIPEGRENTPVTYISWYAAMAYCKYKGMRLPTIDEWEFVAMASNTKRDARDDPEFIKSILSGYETPRTYLKEVKLSKPNFYGLYDLHGVVWEWISDFNSVIISGESRNDGDTGLFCAAGATGSTDLMNYAAFMRYAFRASITARYSIKNLGFRCAQSN